MTKKTGNLIFRVLVLALCVGLLVHFVDLRSATAHIATLSLSCVLLYIVLTVFRHGLSSMRWMFLNPDPTGQWHAFDYFRYTMISNTFNLVMPGALGGDLIRSLYIMKEAESHRASNLLGMLVDRVVGLFSILLLGTICGFLAPGLDQKGSFVLGMGGLFILGMLGAALAMNEGFNQLLGRILRRFGALGARLIGLLDIWAGAASYYRSNRGRVTLGILICFVMHLVSFLAVYLLARNLNLPIGFLSLSIITAISWLITTVPLSFGGLGVRELSFVVLLGTQGIAAEPATALSLAQFGIGLIIAGFGLPFIWMNKRGQQPQVVA
ncbi:MAG: hypothetical protein ACI9TH_002526 [Kiritimatiellia bacterium]|jgi:uncharacterized protein (TIRG00374 family)